MTQQATATGITPPSAPDSARDFASVEAAQGVVAKLASDQLELYARQPKELVGHANRELAAIEGYRGRQLLELLQNADDAAEHSTGGRLLVELLDDCVIVANSGSAFSAGGLESLVISDCSPKQLDRNKYIGCKGLGFRSVLTWSECPLLFSGHLSVAFDRSKAIDDAGERASASHLVLTNRLITAVHRLNPELPNEQCEQVARTLTRPAHPSAKRSRMERPSRCTTNRGS
ncbi:MAG: hypothetical protein IT437_10950 [Phycisphaerales bacterium]|nr:hypothetical protein [Phycisphaerales bacterium]